MSNEGESENEKGRDACYELTLSNFPQERDRQTDRQRQRDREWEAGYQVLSDGRENSCQVLSDGRENL